MEFRITVADCVFRDRIFFLGICHERVSRFQAQAPISRQVRHGVGLKRILESTLQGLHLPLAVAGRVILTAMVALCVRYAFEKH